MKKRNFLIDKEEEYLSYYYDINKEKNELTAEIHFKSITEIKDESVTKNLVINDVLLEKLKSIFKSIPKRYKVNFIVTVDDMQEYSKEELSIALQQKICSLYYTYALEDHRKKKMAFFFFMTGVIFLAVNIILQILKPFEGNTETILNEIIDIIAWVFIWESVTIYSIECHTQRKGLFTIKKRINSISIKNGNENPKKIFDENSEINLIKDEIHQLKNDLNDDKED